MRGGFGATAFLWNILAGGLSRADIVRLSREPTPLIFIILCLAWWFSLSTFLARKEDARDRTSGDPAPRVPPSLILPFTQPKATFFIVPVWAFVLMLLTSTLTWPSIRLNVFGL